MTRREPPTQAEVDQAARRLLADMMACPSCTRALQVRAERAARQEWAAMCALLDARREPRRTARRCRTLRRIERGLIASVAALSLVALGLTWLSFAIGFPIWTGGAGR